MAKLMLASFLLPISKKTYFARLFSPIAEYQEIMMINKYNIPELKIMV